MFGRTFYRWCLFLTELQRLKKKQIASIFNEQTKTRMNFQIKSVSVEQFPVFVICPFFFFFEKNEKAKIESSLHNRCIYVRRWGSAAY